MLTYRQHGTVITKPNTYKIVTFVITNGAFLAMSDLDSYSHSTVAILCCIEYRVILDQNNDRWCKMWTSFLHYQPQKCDNGLHNQRFQSVDQCILNVNNVYNSICSNLSLFRDLRPWTWILLIHCSITFSKYAISTCVNMVSTPISDRNSLRAFIKKTIMMFSNAPYFNILSCQWKWWKLLYVTIMGVITGLLHRHRPMP